MKTIYHKASERGSANHGWLNAHHSFSFADYYDPEKIHFGALRVLNDDTVKAGYGFPKHPHNNMEIITIPLEGSVEHADTTGGHGVIRKDEVQVMSAGSGVFHSERNPERMQDLKLLQIWIFPREQNITPRYDQKAFDPKERSNRFLNIVAPDTDNNSNGALKIHQDAWLSLGDLDKGFATTYNIKEKSNGIYVFVIKGEVTIDGQKLQEKDALGVWDTDKINVTADSDAEVLLLDVPMTKLED